MLLRNPGTPPIDTANSNRILLSMVGVSLLLIFMDVQAGKQIKDRVEALPDQISNRVAPEVRSQVASIPSRAAALEQPVKQSASAIFEGVQNHVQSHAPAVQKIDASSLDSVPESVMPSASPDSRLKVTGGGWDLYFVAYSDRESVIKKVHRTWPQSQVGVRALLQYLQKGPSPRERGLLNPFDSSVRLMSHNLSEGVLTLEFDPSLLRMGAHVIRDRMDQVLFTMTQFPEVQGVRFVVPGEDRPYLNKVLKKPSRKVMSYP